MMLARKLQSPPVQLRILYIGASGSEEVGAELRRGGFNPTFERVTSMTKLESALEATWDIAISAFGEGSLGALEALHMIQERQIDLPLIVVSGSIPNEEVLSVLKAGAADHLTRPHLMRLNAAVERELRAARMRGERTRLEEQFRQAQKMEAVGRLAGGVAHDFNNLLTVITGYSDLLLANPDLKPGQRSALEEIRRSAERGGALTHQLLAFSRRQPLQPRMVRLNELVLQLEKMLRRLIGEDITLITVPAASQDTVEADPGRLDQVVMNLVVNARDAMPEGGKLTIETGTVTLNESFSARRLGVKPGRYVTLCITDTGVGMSAETQSHLFEPFYTTKGPGHGTGLGLATAYGIIRQSGGAISITSEIGHGTTACIYLPLAVKPLPVHEEVQKEQGPLTGAETILLVEDETRVRRLIADVLISRGYQVLEATRGDEALRLCEERKDPIDMAVIDVVMPEMSGPDLVRQITPLHPESLVLYISGYTDEAIIRHGILESGAAFLQKPFLPDALVRKVREVLDSRENTVGE